MLSSDTEDLASLLTLKSSYSCVWEGKSHVCVRESSVLMGKYNFHSDPQNPFTKTNEKKRDKIKC